MQLLTFWIDMPIWRQHQHCSNMLHPQNMQLCKYDFCYKILVSLFIRCIQWQMGACTSTSRLNLFAMIALAAQSCSKSPKAKLQTCRMNVPWHRLSNSRSDLNWGQLYNYSHHSLVGRLPHRVAGIQREITINFLCDILNEFAVFFIFLHPNKCGEKRLVEKI